MDLSEFDIDFLSQKLSDNPQSPLFARLADLYLSKNQSSEALKLCEDGVQTYSTYATGYIVLGKCYLALNENSKARLAFTQALHLAPFNQLARKLLTEIPAGGDDAPPAAEIETPVPPPEIIEAEPQQVETVAEETIPQPTVEEYQPVVEETIPQPVIEEYQPVAEFSASEPIVEEPIQEIIQPAVAEPTVQPEEQHIAEQVPAESVEALSLDDYLQRHTANASAGKMISLDEYLGITSPAPAPANELDSLAAQLENAKRIVPQEPQPEAASENKAPLDLSVITPTLAEIYATQGEYGAAIQAYEILMISKPDERERFEKRIKELQAKLYDGG